MGLVFFEVGEPCLLRTALKFDSLILCAEHIFPIKFKIRILDLMLLPKNSVPFEGLYYSSVCVCGIFWPYSYTF